MEVGRFAVAVDLPAATAPDLAEAMRRIRRLAYVILNGTLVGQWETAVERPRSTV